MKDKVWAEKSPNNTSSTGQAAVEDCGPYLQIRRVPDTGHSLTSDTHNTLGIRPAHFAIGCAGPPVRGLLLKHIEHGREEAAAGQPRKETDSAM